LTSPSSSDTTANDIREADIETVWSDGGLMPRLCSRHRLNVRNGNPTDYDIEQLRTVHYPSYNDSNYFRRVIQDLANRHKEEIRVDGNVIRLTRYALDKTCEKHDPTYQKDFK
jgi:hypothetical protein